MSGIDWQPWMGPISRLWTRLQLVVGRGRVSAPAMDGGPVQKLQIQLGALETRDNTPRVAEFGFTSVPLEDCDAIVIFVGGDRSNGVVIATNDQRHRPTDLLPGDTVIYDAHGNFVRLSAQGIRVTSPVRVEVHAPELRLGGTEVQIHAADRLAVDCGGNGFVWTANTRDDYVIGAVSNSHALHPPEVPS
jgi:phage baseplate assembly protein V